MLLKLRDQYDNQKFAGPLPQQPTTDDFQKPLQAASDRNRIFLWINVSMLLVTFGVCIWLIILYRGQPTTLAEIFGAMGVTMNGLISYMNYLWPQIVAIDLALAMSDRLKLEMYQTIITSMLSRMEPKKRKRPGERLESLTSLRNYYVNCTKEFQR